MMNNLICWKELSGEQKWQVIKKADVTSFLMSLMNDKAVDNKTIFFIPANAIFAGIWLFPEHHKSSRVDFYKFHEDFGADYVRPKIDEVTEKLVKSYNEEHGPDTKYGWISPEGKYFHCNYQGHVNLADRICFGMIDTTNPERYLEEHGWCKIFKPLGYSKYSVYVGGKHTLTDAQLKKLTELKLEDADGINYCLCKDLDDFE